MTIKKTVTTSSGITTVSVEGLVFFEDRISGITSVVDPNDVANKTYAESKLDLSLAGQEGKFYTTTDGTNYSWDYVSNYQEFTTSGPQTFILPPHTSLLFVEAVGAGSGGSAGQTTELAGLTWVARTTSQISGSGGSSSITYGNNLYVASLGYPTRIITSTDSFIWTQRTFPSTNNPLNLKLKYIGNFYISSVYGNSPGIFSYLQVSTNGIVWTLRTTNSIDTNVSNNVDFTFGNNNYVTVGASGDVRTSTDTIMWIRRTSGTTSSFNAITYGNNNYVAAGAALRTSTDTINWVARTSGTTVELIDTAYVNNLFIAVGSNLITVSTNTIVWISRTSPVNVTFNTVNYSNNLYFVGGGGFVCISTDTISWSARTLLNTTSVDSSTYNDNLLLVSSRDWTVSASYIQKSGQGGASGSYTSWYIPRNIVYSNLTINPGVGGTGGTTNDAPGSVGAATTISWTGPNNQPYTLTASPTAANTVASSSFLYTTAGLTGAPSQFLSSSSGVSGPNQTNRSQPTSGGSGALESGTGGSSGAVYQYGTTIQASGGTPGNNGSNAEVVSGLSYGLGGGGGGATVSIAATGGNGVRGGGGGGGAVSGTLFGNGGNGGDGYVKITWW